MTSSSTAKDPNTCITHPNDCQQKRIPKFYLIISNISKKNNIRSLLLTAATFQCDTVFLAGQPSYNISTDVPKQLSSNKMKIVHYPNLLDCINHIHTNYPSIKIIGVEITDKSRNVDENVFQLGKDVVFMMGNEGSGMSKSQMKYCDEFVKIRQFGNGTASLNVNVATGVVLHTFDAWRRKHS